MGQDEIFNSKDAAKHVGVAGKTIRRWIKRGKLPAEKVGGEFRIQKKDLMSAYLSAYNHRPAPPVHRTEDILTTVDIREQGQEKQAHAEAVDRKAEPIDGQQVSPVPYPVHSVSIEDDPLVKELRSQIKKWEDRAETDSVSREEMSFKLGRAMQENHQLQERVKLLEAPQKENADQPEPRRRWWPPFQRN